MFKLIKSKSIYPFFSLLSSPWIFMNCCELVPVFSLICAFYDPTVAPAGVTITGPTEAKAEDQVLITCTTENSNPPADIKWTVDGHNFESNASKTELAPNGGWITSSNVTFSINRKSRSIVVICHASNAKLTENVVGTHTINVICEHLSSLSYNFARCSVQVHHVGTLQL